MRVVWNGLEEVVEDDRGDGKGLLHLVLGLPSEPGECLPERAVSCGSRTVKSDPPVHSPDGRQVGFYALGRLETADDPQPNCEETQVVTRQW